MLKEVRLLWSLPQKPFHPTETGRLRVLFFDGYISKGWLSGTCERYYLGKTGKILGEYLHLERAEKELVFAIFVEEMLKEKEGQGPIVKKKPV